MEEEESGLEKKGDARKSDGKEGGRDEVGSEGEKGWTGQIWESGKGNSDGGRSGSREEKGMKQKNSRDV